VLALEKGISQGLTRKVINLSCETRPTDEAYQESMPPVLRRAAAIGRREDLITAICDCRIDARRAGAAPGEPQQTAGD